MITNSKSLIIESNVYNLSMSCNGDIWIRPSLIHQLETAFVGYVMEWSWVVEDHHNMLILLKISA